MLQGAGKMGSLQRAHSKMRESKDGPKEHAQQSDSHCE
jgi:hypothetical protein